MGTGTEHLRKPMEVSDKHFDSEWERIFGKKDKADINAGTFVVIDPEVKEKKD